MTDHPDMRDDTPVDDITLRRTAHLLRDAMPAADFSVPPLRLSVNELLTVVWS